MLTRAIKLFLTLAILNVSLDVAQVYACSDWNTFSNVLSEERQLVPIEMSSNSIKHTEFWRSENERKVLNLLAFIAPKSSSNHHSNKKECKCCDDCKCANCMDCAHGGAPLLNIFTVQNISVDHGDVSAQFSDFYLSNLGDDIFHPPII